MKIEPVVNHLSSFLPLYSINFSDRLSVTNLAVDSGNIVIPFQTKQIAMSWINNEVSDGILMDAIQKTVETEAINIPYVIDEQLFEKIYIPDWVKIVAV